VKETDRNRWRLLGFVALCVVCVATGTGYVLHSRSRAVAQAGSAPAPAAKDSVAAVEAEPHVLFRNLSAAAQAGYVGLAPLSDPNGSRQITGYECRRLYMAAGRGLCLAEDEHDPLTPYKARFFGPDFTTVHELPLAGLPSRARVSADGSLGAATVFVNGDSYSGGAFSTRTTIFDMNTGTSLGDLESFTVMRDGKRIQSVDFNFWGITFARQAGRFYATLGTGGHTYLVQGDLSTRTVTVLRDGVECPSLSPDGTRIAFKSRVAGSSGLNSTQWRLSVLDLATLQAHPLAETRSVDDQAEWLDNGTVLYSVGSDTWAVPADGRGAPHLFVAGADSPVVLPAG
jgi:hypothetical protein